MTIKELAFRVEDLQNKAAMINSMQNALFAGIYRGNLAPKTYEWAFVAFGHITFDLAAEMESLVDELFAALKSGKQ